MGWAPYGYLVYLAFFVIPPVLGHATLAQWAVTLAALAVFLVLYFRAYWVHGRHVLPYAWAIAALGAALMPFNSGAAGFFIYAAAFVGEIEPVRVALRWVVAIAAAGAAASIALNATPWTWLPAAVMPLLIGATNVHYADSRRAKDRLLRAQAEVEHLAQVAERERIGRDLHDLLGHTLSLVALKSELAAKLADRDPERSRAEIRDVERIAREALAEVRAAVEGYRSRTLIEELAAARAACRAAGVALEAELAPPPLTTAAESVLAMALREAVTNVVRHAGARHCRVSVRADEEGVCLEVRDDGCGGLAGEGRGLSGMRARLEKLGGRLERDGSAGTCLRARLPLERGPSLAAAASAPALPVAQTS